MVSVITDVGVAVKGKKLLYAKEFSIWTVATVSYYYFYNVIYKSKKPNILPNSRQ